MNYKIIDFVQGSFLTYINVVFQITREDKYTSDIEKCVKESIIYFQKFKKIFDDGCNPYQYIVNVGYSHDSKRNLNFVLNDLNQLKFYVKKLIQHLQEILNMKKIQNSLNIQRILQYLQSPTVT